MYYITFIRDGRIKTTFTNHPDLDIQFLTGFLLAKIVACGLR